jgi:ribonuclease-3
MASLTKLTDRLGIVIRDPQLLVSALTHPSYMHERPTQTYELQSSERLEFLGDAVLNYLAADLVFTHFPDQSEGELTTIRAALIKTSTLAMFARELDLGTYLRLSRGEEQSGARHRAALLADTFEAVLAAIYLDQGLEAARAFLQPLLEPQINQVKTHGLPLDYKSLLQRRIQAERNLTPTYRVIAEQGPEHRRAYTLEVLAGNERIGTGSGLSKQAAAQEAARVALEHLDQITPREA